MSYAIPVIVGCVGVLMTFCGQRLLRLMFALAGAILGCGSTFIFVHSVTKQLPPAIMLSLAGLALGGILTYIISSLGALAIGASTGAGIAVLVLALIGKGASLSSTYLWLIVAGSCVVFGCGCLVSRSLATSHPWHPLCRLHSLCLYSALLHPCILAPLHSCTVLYPCTLRPPSSVLSCILVPACTSAPVRPCARAPVPCIPAPTHLACLLQEVDDYLLHRHDRRLRRDVCHQPVCASTIRPSACAMDVRLDMRLDMRVDMHLDMRV